MAEGTTLTLEVEAYLRKHGIPIPTGDKPEENQMMHEARIGPEVRDYIPAELAARFPDLVMGVGRPDFIPDEAYLAKKQRATITRFQEEYGLLADPANPPNKVKTHPFLNPLTGEREVPKVGSMVEGPDGQMKKVPPSNLKGINGSTTKVKKKPGRPKKVKAVANGNTDDIVQPG